MFHSSESSSGDFFPANLPPPTFADEVDEEFFPAVDPPNPPSPDLSPDTSTASSPPTTALSTSSIAASPSSHTTTDTSSSSTPAASPSLHTTVNTSPSSRAPNSPLHDTQPAPRRSERFTKGVPPPKFNDYLEYGVDSIAVPTHYRQAKGHPLWEAAMRRELEALHANNTWTLVPRPPSSTSVVGCRWVYTVKTKPDGTVNQYKARLVAQGFTQEYGIDCSETFAPVAKVATVRTLLSVASLRQWPLYQMDVKNSFFHSDLDEVIYMEPPPGYPLASPDQICRLNRSLYGLKQAPRAWFDKFHTTISNLGFQQSRNDPSLFTRTTAAGAVALLLYVDDMAITGSDHDGIQRLKEGLNASFNLKDLGELSYFLGLEVNRDSRGILLCQHKYIPDLMDDHQFIDCRPVSTPMELNLRLGRDSGMLLPDNKVYRSIVGSLIYLSATRPDISYAVQVVSQFMDAPRSDHLAAVHRILRYLQGTCNVGIFFPSTGDLCLQAFSDSDFAGCVDSR
ncbi:unnamed protein product [Linum trigynum]|uniref:Reverse transcriptase Ty1/copia-type domain-containing protein n=1 Tax=Linum trigynum TaxID=586398 RepID=A0AAV2D6H6_9ROSI